MDKILPDFEILKISAFSKYSQLTGDVNNVTIGPHSTGLQDGSYDETTRKIKTKKVSFEKEKTPNTSPLPLPHVLKEFESQRREKLQEAIDDRFSQFENFAKRQKEEKETQWFLKQQAFIQNVQESEQIILQTINQQDVNRSKQNEKLIKHYQDMVQRKLHYEQQLERHKEKQRVLNENIEKIMKYQLEFKTVYQEIIAVIKASASVEELKKMLGESFKVLKSLHESFDEVISRCKSYNVDEEQLSKAANILIQSRNLKLQIEENIYKITAKKKAEQAKVPIQSETIKKDITPKTSDDTKSTVVGLNQCVSVHNLKKYAEVKQFLLHHSNLFQNLLNDEQLKQFRFDCKKAVNIPVNAISAVSAEHLRDKYTKLNNLLSGKTVAVADKQINAARQAQGIPFCMDLLAKKFVLQGDLMISSNPEAAFCYATIIISLWNDFPDFGKLLLGYFYTQCPYLVPFYIPKTEDQTNEDYYVSLGYNYVDGQIEKQDKFLKRMTGILRLYFAIMIANPKRDQTKNPYDIKNAWNFLASIIKLDPQLDITATSLHIFLETVGFEMERVYGFAFKKLVKIINDKFMPLLTKMDSGGPVTRLEVLLQDYKVKGHFEKPNGILEYNFW